MNAVAESPTMDQMLAFSRVKGDPIAWLLEPDSENPGVRYIALTDLLGRQPDDPEVIIAKRMVMTTGTVARILAAQLPDGSWGTPADENSYRSTVWQILCLAELGADPTNEGVQRGCDYLLNYYMAANGAFATPMPKPIPSRAVHCHNGEVIAALIRLGFLDDPRLQLALAWQTQAITGEGEIHYYKSSTIGPGFACAANLGQPCAWGATKALRALNLIPSEKRTPLIKQAVKASVDFLLSHDLSVADYPFTQRINSSWFKFGFPLSYQSDILETATALADAGCGYDPRLANAIDFIVSKQDKAGRWIMERSLNGKMLVDIEEKGKPSKWITLRALHVLKRVGQ